MNTMEPLRILLIEDDPGDAGLVRVYLRKAGLIGASSNNELICCSALAEALDQAQQIKPDVTLLDLSLPDSAGLPTVRALYAALPESPIVVLTGRDDAEFALQALEAGAQDYLIKGSFDHDSLSRAIRYAQTRGRLESRLRLLDAALNAAANGIVITDAEARIEWANPAFTQLTGYALEEAQGHQPKELIQSGLNPVTLYKAMWNTILSGQVWSGELINRRKDGRFYDEELTITPVTDGRDGIHHFVAVKQDITARKRTEQALQDIEQRWQRALEGSGQGVWDWNVATNEVFFSPQWKAMLGYENQEIGNTLEEWKARVHPDDLESCYRDLQRNFAGETPTYRNEHRMLCKDGSYKWILDRGMVFEWTADHQPLRVVGTHTDTTERRYMEEALRVSLAEVKRHDAQMVALNRLNDLLLSCETHEEAYAVIARNAGRLFVGWSGGLAALDPDIATELRVVSAWGRSTLLTTFPLSQCWALRRGEVYGIATRQNLQCRHFSHSPTSASLCIPLNVRGNLLGLLHLSADMEPTEAQFLEMRTFAITVSESIKLALSNLKLRAALREQAIRDPLTGLFNRRYLDETLPRELHRRQRRGEPLTAAMLDVDHFKRFNDGYGHEAGDAVLRAMGDLLNRSLRADDIACRYGGEELTLVMPGSSLEDAEGRLESLRRAIMQMRILHQGGDLPAITVSIGVAAAEEQEVDAAALLARADTALYQAKEQGRNRVVVFSYS
jgi:diguanylate cyclase (GGDEF)-like protein/PAS domain S-box-containing protein